MRKRQRTEKRLPKWAVNKGGTAIASPFASSDARGVFYDIGNCSAILCYKNTLRVRRRTRMRGSVASQSCSARQKCASFRVYYNARVREAHLCYVIGNFVPYKAKPSGGSHCGRKELCRSCDPPQAENLASEILCSDIGNFVSNKAKLSGGSHCGVIGLCH